MASGVFWEGGRAGEVADFDEYDPTPYGGGYDLALTFGRALPPSQETCYPVSTNTSSSCDRPQYGRRPEADESYGAAEQHRRRPQHEDSTGYGGGGGNYGRRPHAEEESHGSSAGFGYGRKAHDDDHGESYGSAAGGYRKPKPAYGDERPKYQGGGDDDDRPNYVRKKHDDDDDDRPNYGRKKHDDDDDSDGERKPRYKEHDDEDDSDDEKKQRYGKNNRRRHGYDD